jgi:hypothetical protein
METNIIEKLELIATRIPPGDRWKLTNDKSQTTYNSLTDTLEAYFQLTGFKGEYRLAPLDSKIYIIQTEEYIKEIEPPKTYSFYGEFKQGI